MNILKSFKIKSIVIEHLLANNENKIIKWKKKSLKY
jgi:hypothetical protein